MNTMIFRFSGLILLLLAFNFTACTDSEDVTDTQADAYSEELVFRTQEAANLGRFGCYELIFPVTLAFPNGQSVQVDSYEQMQQAFRRWKMNNPRVRTMPSIAFPYEVINESGEVILVESLQQQRALRLECRKTFFDQNGPQGHNDRPKLCFKPVPPFNIMLPDSSIFTVNDRDDRKALQQAIREWRKNNPDSSARPVLVFPMNFKLEDGTVVTINSREELKALKESCD
jgi:invasion protein IalB